MTKILNVATGLLALWCFLSFPSPSSAQTSAPSSFAQLHGGQPFPYALGVGVELSTYTRIREKLTLADVVIESKARLNDSLMALLTSERTLHQLDVLTLQLTEREYSRQTRTFEDLAASYDRAVTAAAAAPPVTFRPLLLQRSFWLGAGAGAAVGILLDAILSPR